MLNMYQLWLDDLYPRAKFADALAIIEKVGHTKRMQMMRKEWIDEGKPRRSREQDDEDVDGIVPEQPAAEQDTGSMEGVEGGEDIRHAISGSTEHVPDRTASEAGAADDPDEDELDALLAESAHFATSAPKTLSVRIAGAEEDPFADEMEAMAGMDDW
jgi:replication fork protection complex subunit Csm3/Swi3